jgi:hypothetical protein
MNRIDKASFQGLAVILGAACVGAVVIGVFYLLGWV